MPRQFELFPLHRRLFPPVAVREALRGDHGSFPDLAKLNHWKRMLEDDERREAMNEESFKAEFLADIFGELLGYRSASESDVYDLRREVHGPSDLRPADAVLGFLGSLETEHVRAVIEIKPPGTRLEARSSRADRLSPVDQGFLYAGQFEDVRWIIVSNFDEIRLYSRLRGATAYESFELAALEGTDLHKFLVLLRRENLIGDGVTPPFTQQLAEETWRAQANISRDFYAEYQEARLELFRELRAQNPGVAPLDILRATQTLLDRVLFILFCTARALIPRGVLQQLRQTASPGTFLYGPDTLWTGLLRLFDAVNVGNPPAGITGYNGGLFARGPLDSLVLRHVNPSREFVLARVLSWDRFDFESQIDVDILGHIFENSISDIEKLKREVIANPETPSLSWRNREGVFYTPEWVTSYIARHTVERYLDDNPSYGPDLKVVDPACGSGAFLTQLVALFRERLHQLAPEEAATLDRLIVRGNIGLFEDPTLIEPTALYAILKRSVYGVDKSPDSIEITKLAVWLQTVVHGHALPLLERNIQQGNSLLDDARIASDAFVWNRRWHEATESGFDCVIGNPPWGADTSEYETGLDRFELARGQFDTAFVFVELAISLLKPGGILGFIVPDSILINEDQLPVRRFLLEKNTVLEVIKLGEGVFRGVFRGSVILIVKKGLAPNNHSFRTLVVTRADRREINDVASAVDLDVLLARRGSTVALGRVLNHPGREIPVNMGEEDYAIVEKIELRRLDWTANVERGRGVELNADGYVIQCPICFKWDPPPQKRKGEWQEKTCTHCAAVFRLEESLSQAHLVLDQPPQGNAASYLDGTDIERYGIARLRSIDLSKEGIAYKDADLYSSPKIVLRQTGIGITATLDSESSSYVPQSVYIFRLREDRPRKMRRLRLSYILAVLNSRVMMYYFLRHTGQSEWQSFPRWTMGRIFELPVREIDFSNSREERLHDRIADAAEAFVAAGPARDTEDDLAIEKLIMDLYEIEPDQRLRIWETLRSIQGVQTVTALLPRSDSRSEATVTDG